MTDKNRSAYQIMYEAYEKPVVQDVEFRLGDQDWSQEQWDAAPVHMVVTMHVRSMAQAANWQAVEIAYGMRCTVRWNVRGEQDFHFVKAWR